jgi:hypothetical protein
LIKLVDTGLSLELGVKVPLLRHWLCQNTDDGAVRLSAKVMTSIQ